MISVSRCWCLDSFQNILLYEDELVEPLSVKQHPLSHLERTFHSAIKNRKITFTSKIYKYFRFLVIEACHQNHFNPYIHRHGRIETILSAASENEGIALVMKKSLHIFILMKC